MGSVNHTKRTRSRVIAQFRALGMIGAACRAVGVDRSAHYDWLKKFPEYKAEFEAAAEPVGDLILEEVVTRAIVGWEEPVFSGGKRALDFQTDAAGALVLDPATGKPKATPALIRKKSDACLLALAAARVPGFSQKAAARSGTGKDPDGEMEVTVVYKNKPIPTDATDPE